VDVIGLYMSEEIPRGTPAEETCRRIRDQGGVVYLPHPYARGKGGSGMLAETLAPFLDVVEVFNARLRSSDRNARAEDLAGRHGLLRSAGSDAHTVHEIGNAWVDVPRHRNEPAAFLDALGDASVHGRRAGLHVFALSNWAKLRKKMPGS
ncbi:MAG: PHP-associated domain-containing protein, partial [Gemmatimonadota bacterium]